MATAEYLRRALVNNLPAVIALHPVLAFFHAVVQVVAFIILLEVDHDQIGLVGVGKHAEIGNINLDPGFAGIHHFFLPRPVGEVGIATGEVVGIVLEVGVGVAAGPIGAPLFDFTQQCGAVGLGSARRSSPSGW